VGISSQLDVLAVKLNGDIAVARQHLDIAQKMARYSLTEARRSVTDLRTSELEDQGLPAALVAAANKWAAGSHVRVQVDVSGEPQQLSGDMEQNLLRIGQEAVANALKHARATIIRVELEMKARAVCLRVKDDGQGFEPARAFSVMDGHFGILGMRERAERLGGEFDLASGAGAGTQVEVTVPLASKTSKTH
jgi:signal transduction histidine kinase